MKTFRTAYDEHDQISADTGLRMLKRDTDPKTGFLTDELVPDLGYTQQQFAEEADINTIVRRFGLTGELPSAMRAPIYGDFTGITNYQDALNAVLQAEAGFNDLPADLRERFANDPARMLQFLADDRNKDEAIKLGLVNKPPEQTRDVVQAVDELAAKLTKDKP